MTKIHCLFPYDFRKRFFNSFLDLQILFKYPPGKRLAMRFKDLAAFCFPGGVKVCISDIVLCFILVMSM